MDMDELVRRVDALPPRARAHALMPLADLGRGLVAVLAEAHGDGAYGAEVHALHQLAVDTNKATRAILGGGVVADEILRGLVLELVSGRPQQLAADSRVPPGARLAVIGLDLVGAALLAAAESEGFRHNLEDLGLAGDGVRMGTLDEALGALDQLEEGRHPALSPALAEVERRMRRW